MRARSTFFREEGVVSFSLDFSFCSLGYLYFDVQTYVFFAWSVFDEVDCRFEQNMNVIQIYLDCIFICLCSIIWGVVGSSEEL